MKKTTPEMNVELEDTIKIKKDFELEKIKKDFKEIGFAMYDQEHHTRINPETIALFWNEKGKKKKRAEYLLRRDLMIIEKIFKEKFKNPDPYDTKLLEKDVGVFMERLIRATEICTMKYVLGIGGALNKCKQCGIIMRKHRFVWED